MKIGIFCEPHQAALGGSEYRVACPGGGVPPVARRRDRGAIALSSPLTRCRVCSGTELDGVTVRHIPFAGRATRDGLMSGGVFARQNNGWRS